MSFTYLLLLFFSVVFSETILNECTSTPTGEICLTLESVQCFELAGTISWNGIVFTPEPLQINTLLQEIQQKTQDPNFDPSQMICQAISPELPCTFCATVDQLQVSDVGTLHYCGEGQLNCSGLAPVKQNFTIPCIEINNCQLFSCRNQCSQQGQCTSLGICECNQDHYGLDCSLYLTPNCVSSPSFPLTCWKTQFLDCRTFQVTVTTGLLPLTETYKLNEIESIPVVPCTPFISEDNLQCEICVNMDNITIEGKQLIGCPTVITSCNSITVSETQMDCFPLADTSELICEVPVTPTLPGNFTGDSDVSKTSKTILIVLVGVLAVLMLIGLVYLFLTRYMGFQPQFELASPETYMEDEEPLREDS